jgi:hypothetical protein
MPCGQQQTNKHQRDPDMITENAAEPNPSTRCKTAQLFNKWHEPQLNLQLMRHTMQDTVKAPLIQAKRVLSSATTTNQCQHLLLYKHVLVTTPPANTRTHDTTTI